MNTLLNAVARLMPARSSSSSSSSSYWSLTLSLPRIGSSNHFTHRNNNARHAGWAGSTSASIPRFWVAIERTIDTVRSRNRASASRSIDLYGQITFYTRGRSGRFEQNQMSRQTTKQMQLEDVLELHKGLLRNNKLDHWTDLSLPPCPRKTSTHPIQRW